MSEDCHPFAELSPDDIHTGDFDWEGLIKCARRALGMEVTP